MMVLATKLHQKSEIAPLRPQNLAFCALASHECQRLVIKIDPPGY